MRSKHRRALESVLEPLGMELQQHGRSGHLRVVDVETGRYLATATCTPADPDIAVVNVVRAACRKLAVIQAEAVT